VKIELEKKREDKLQFCSNSKEYGGKENTRKITHKTE
jgi:hypothetical protein